MTPKLRILLTTVCVTLPLDQVAKYWVATSVARGERVAVIEGFFDISHVRNSGAAFGMLAQAPDQWRTLLFLGLGFAALVVIAFFYRELAPGDRLSAFALSLILGGALGNLTDRAVRGEVIDFLRIRLVGGYSWPDFNFADVFIVTGVTALAIELLADEGKSRASASASEVEPD